MPASRALLVAAVATLLLAVSVSAPMLAWIALAVDAFLVVAGLADHRRAAIVDIAARRTWPPLLAQGTAATVEVRFRSARPVVIVAREALHPGLAGAPVTRRLDVSPGDGGVWRYSLLPRRRGSHVVGPLTIRVLGPWALAWAQRDLLPAETRRVYPRVRWDARVGRLLEMAHRHDLGRAPLHLQGAGTEPYALRAYQAGDPPSRIHWKATARQGRLVSREDAWERGGRLVILLDAARAMASLDGGRSKLDHALAAALALTRVALSRGDRVTLVAFSSRVDRLVRLAPGPQAESSAYASLFDLEARLVEPAYEVAAEKVSAVESRRSTVVVFTSVVDLSATEVLREALLRLRRRHRPVLVNLEDPEVARLALSAPASPAEAFAKVSSLAILLSNRRLGGRLSRAGIRTVSTAADRLALETLETYLRLPHS